METKPEHAEIIALLKQGRTTKPLSAQALETLAIVALKQPVTTEEVNAIRGLDSYATIKTLVKRKLIWRGTGRGWSSPSELLGDHAQISGRIWLGKPG
jgi:segregation and condensation protein B